MKNKREVLIAVAGLTPQIITETLYYLTQCKKPAVNISEAYVLTTSEGRKRVENLLLKKGKGKFFQFLKEYGLEGKILFSETNIIVIKDKNGKELKDIVTEEDNECAANQIIDFIRKMTHDENVVLHCSVAGGRKTMGLYMGYALQLFGRDKDTLSHVLVSEDFESHPDFFYKPRLNQEMKTKNGKNINTKDVRIRLAEIDYIRLRAKLLDIFGTEEVGYREMVERANGLLDPCLRIRKLQVDVCKKRLVVVLDVEEKCINLTPQQIALFAFYAENAIKGRNFLRDVNENTVQRFYKLARPGTEDLKSDSLKPDSLNQIRSKIRSCISKVLRDKLLAFCVMASKGEHGEKEYGIAIDKDKIEIIK